MAHRPPSEGPALSSGAHASAISQAATIAEDEAVTFASDLIRIDTSNRGGGDCRERPAAEYVAERLAEAGLEPVLLEAAPGRANVVARIAGTDPAADGLLAHGHLDVVPAQPGDWARHPFSGEISGGLLHGRGAVDMKNADAVLVAVARQLARTGTRPRRDVVLAFTADEEDIGAYGAAGWWPSILSCLRAAPRRSGNPAASPFTPGTACGCTRSPLLSEGPPGCGSPHVAGPDTAPSRTRTTPCPGSPQRWPGSALTSGRCG
jgi:hypothetical protein